MKEEKKAADKKWIKRILAGLFWLCIWQLTVLLVDNNILLAGPVQTAVALFYQVFTVSFWQIIGVSFLRIFLGFFLASVLGGLLGAAAQKWPLLGELLSPFMLFCKAVPVASFAVMLLIWWGSGWLSTAVIFLVGLPMVYVNIYEGLKHADVKLLEMARVSGMPFWNRMFYIYRPSLAPFMESCIRTAVGMGIKAGVAAEVIGIPKWSVGGELYMSKIYLDTAGVFAWTVVVIVMGFCMEKAVLFLWNRFCGWKPGPCRGRQKTATPVCISMEDICKSYDGHKVFWGITKKLEAGRIYCLMGASGAGKTTLLHILAGLVKPEKGKTDICGEKKPKGGIYVACMFQEDRLCEEENAVVNVKLVSHDHGKAEECLKELLPQEAIPQPVKKLSGGMRRRVCLARALAVDADLLLLDEPFTGLDEENRRKAAEVLIKYRQDRLTVVVTHDAEDVKNLGGEIWRL